MSANTFVQSQASKATPIQSNPIAPTISKMQSVLVRIHQTSELARIGMQSKDTVKAGRALVALGICQQAKEQVNAACQNLGFPITSLMSIDQSIHSDEAGSCGKQLKEAKIELVKFLTKKLSVSRDAVFFSMNAFAEEAVIQAAFMLARAEQYLSVSQKSN
jgi:hypothetical protein